MIRFACVGCGKQHRIPDDQAGLPGRCGHCGQRFMAPGVAQAPAVAVGPAPARWSRTRLAGGLLIPAGVVSGVILVAVLAILAIEWARREPAKVAPPVVALRPAEPGVWTFDVERVVGILVGIFVLLAVLAVFTAATLGPLILPIVLSRRGRLSVGRWAALAALCLFLLALGVGLVVVTMVPAAYVRGGLGTAVGLACGLYLVALHSGVIGCLIAAAAHPKPPGP